MSGREFKSFRGLPVGDFGHSNFYVGEKGNSHDMREATFRFGCYSPLTYRANDVVEKDFTSYKGCCPWHLILHPDQADHEYIDYLINSSYWADVFVTKDLEEGFQFGFTVDLRQPYAYRNTALQAFRFPTEFYRGRAMAKLRELDPDIPFMVLVAMLCGLDLGEEGGWYAGCRNINHTPYVYCQNNLAGFLNCLQNKFHTNSTNSWDGTGRSLREILEESAEIVIEKDHFLREFKRFKYTDASVASVIQTLKGMIV